MVVFGRSRIGLAIFLSSLVFTGCKSEGESPKSKRIITNQAPAAPGPNGDTDAPPTPSGTPTCLEYSKTVDTDNDGLKDYDEFVGANAFSFDSILRSDPFNPDTDGDARIDGDEIHNRKVNGLSINDLLIQEFPTHPSQRDFVILVSARGGSDSTPAAATGNGWNIYSGFGTLGAATEKTRPLRLRSEDSIEIIDPANTSLLDRTKIDAGQRPVFLPNICVGNDARQACSCWMGDPDLPDEVGCVLSPGIRLEAAGNQAVGARSPAMSCARISAGGTLYYDYECAYSTFMNSLIGRLVTSTDSSATRTLRTATPTTSYEAFRLGSLAGNAAQIPETGSPFPVTQLISYSNSNAVGYRLTGVPENMHLLLKKQDTNSGTSNNSGFVLLILRFRNNESTWQRDYGAFSSDADRQTKLSAFLNAAATNSGPYAGHCRLQ